MQFAEAFRDDEPVALPLSLEFASILDDPHRNKLPEWASDQAAMVPWQPAQPPSVGASAQQTPLAVLESLSRTALMLRDAAVVGHPQQAIRAAQLQV
jgi:hypothetical protein